MAAVAGCRHPTAVNTSERSRSAAPGVAVGSPRICEAVYVRHGNTANAGHRQDVGDPAARRTRRTRPLHQAAHRVPVRVQFGGDIGQQPLPPDQPVLRVGPRVGEAEFDDQRGDPLPGEPAPLPGQLLPTRWEGDVLGGQRLADVGSRNSSRFME